ncbi:MAG TPA: hemolysin family protein [Clostridiales bacterium]|nr:hemolysin family protein [Clostridiales bacterium]HQP70545.1 hemolysin family protein [Clostridiales bacterium]
MLIILVIITLILSAFFSMSEIIFTVADRIKIRVLSKAGVKSALYVKKLIKNPDNFLVPVLVGNNIANTAYATFFAYLVADLKWNISQYQSTFVITIILVIFSEMIPKILGKKYSNQLASKVVYPFLFLKAVFYPITHLVDIISKRLLKLMGIHRGKDNWVVISRDDIGVILEQAEKTRAVKKADAAIIKSIMNLDERKVKEIMLHRKNIIAVDIKSPVYRLKKMIMLTSFSKIIVYDNDLDDIKGAAFVNDLLKDPQEIKDIIRPVMFIPENASVLTLFKSLQKEKSTIAIAIDEFGGCVGLVTMHDILELIIGKVDDPHDSRKSDRGIIYRSENRTFIVAGNADLEELDGMIRSITGGDKELFGDKNETVNGFIINHLQRIPELGETFEIRELKFKIVKARRNFVETIIIQLKEMRESE